MSKGNYSLATKAFRQLAIPEIRVVSKFSVTGQTKITTFSPNEVKFKCSGFQSTGFKQNAFISKFSTQYQVRRYSTEQHEIIQVPPMGDSISDGDIQKWHKNPGEFVKSDDLVVSIETDKVVMDIRAPKPGKIVETYANVGEKVKVGANLYKLDISVAPPAETPKEASKPTPKETPKPTKETPPTKQADTTTTPIKTQPTTPPSQPPKTETPVLSGPRGEQRVKMTRLRERVAERLKGAQNTYAMLTTMNEVDMTNLMELRNTFKDEFQEKHNAKLGFMSCFLKAAANALREQPAVNAVIDGSDIVYRDYVDISVAVATPTGLIVPVIRDCDKLSFAQIEKTLANLSKKARDSTLSIEEITGGTFTISNGGVYGSMLGTPIINPPQSAILGMHAVNKRAVVVNDQIVIRPMMYLALTYDHRLIDGKDAVTFLKRIRDYVQDPRRLLLDL